MATAAAPRIQMVQLNERSRRARGVGIRLLLERFGEHCIFRVVSRTQVERPGQGDQPASTSTHISLATSDGKPVVVNDTHWWDGRYFTEVSD